MVINIDTVYQKVLAIANKEQRGYITPQEFNLMADKAQMEIFNNYFHDVKTAVMKSKNDFNFADELEMLDQKISAFKRSTEITCEAEATSSILPNAYFIDTIRKKDTNIVYTKLNKKEIRYAESNPLTKATTTRPTYVRKASGSIDIYPKLTEQTVLVCDYYAQPAKPKWGYVVIKGRALFNAANPTTQNFSLHKSEEENLVNRILQLAGVIIQKPGLVEIGMQEKASAKQEQND